MIRLKGVKSLIKNSKIVYKNVFYPNPDCTGKNKKCKHNLRMMKFN